jgi:hypothetical protein
MDRKRPVAGGRAVSFAVALFAITLNFLQPLAHAALMRDGSPEAMASLWGAFCMAPTAGDEQSQSSTPASGKIHECCLGLAHAPAVAQPTSTFVLVEFTAVVVRFSAAPDTLAAVGIRDGPSQPRGPPLPV